MSTLYGEEYPEKLGPVDPLAKDLVYVVGFPGSGKTSAVSIALGDQISEVRTIPFAHTLHTNGIVELGERREPYGGTDTLAMDIQPKVVNWLGQIIGMSRVSRHVIVGEGDRLGNLTFLNSAMELGWRVMLVYLMTPELVARERAWSRGSRFDEQWFHGRMVKVDNLVRNWEHKFRVIEGTRPVNEVGATLRTMIDGVIYG